MFNSYQYYSFFQPTFVFFPPFVSNYSQISFPAMGSEKTEVEKETINNQIGQLSTQSKKIKTIDLLRRQIRRGQTKKTAIVHRKKQPQRKENEITEVYIPEVKVQKNETKKRKSTSKLLFDIEWKNQNRNIIPNIMNQMLSFVQKRHKSERLTAKLFLKYEHDENWTISKYYCYMKRMKASMGHYINENELNFINKIHEPDFELYSRQEQMFYLKICRISVEYFFKTESILVSLTSNRMSQKKRKAHLIARRALLNRVQQLLKEATY